MFFTSVNRAIFGLLALILGVSFWVAAPKQITVAGDVTTYTSTWEPQDYLIARRYKSTTESDEVVLGVATWKVKGNFGSSGPFFKEIWESPSDPPTFTQERTMIGGTLGNWIAGAIFGHTNVTIERIEIMKKPSERNIEIWPPKPGGAAVAGHTASCRETQNECIFANGSYGFTNYHDYTQATSGKDRTNGVVIPVRWTVTGTVCELSSQPECQ